MGEEGPLELGGDVDGPRELAADVGEEGPRELVGDMGDGYNNGITCIIVYYIYLIVNRCLSFSTSRKNIASIQAVVYFYRPWGKQKTLHIAHLCAREELVIG